VNHPTADSAPAIVARPRRAHLVGIAGAGMRGLAELLVRRGWRVSGSDPAAGAVRSLGGQGGRLFAGHAAEHVDRAVELLIHSDAVRPDNPELLQAGRLGVPRLSYFQAAGALTSGLEVLAVAGTHGKSTTAAMLAEILVQAGEDPLVLSGGAPPGRISGARAGSGRVAVVEACEYRANFLHLRPQQAVILNIEPDHFDCFPAFDQLEAAFARFAALLPAEGRLLVPVDCPVARRIALCCRARVETFGLGRAADWSARALRCCGGCYQFELFQGRTMLERICLRVPGRHNVVNALAAAALAVGAGSGSGSVSPAVAARALARFRGIGRRLELVGCLQRPMANGRRPKGDRLRNDMASGLADRAALTRGTVWGGGLSPHNGREVVQIDDYAHLPAEIAAGLLSLRRWFPDRRLWCVFQPHQASRTARLLDELAGSLENADELLIGEIFRAREAAASPGEVTAAHLARRLRNRGRRVPAVHRPAEIVELLAQRLQPGDLVVTMGAGDIRKVHHELAYRFREDRSSG